MTSSPAASGTWHSVTPATRPLSLTILELTPLALTLSLTLASPSSLAPSNPAVAARKRRTGTRGHAHTHHRRDSDNDVDTEHEDGEGHNHVAIPGSWPLDVGRSFKDLLSHGVVVSVNGQPWNRIVAHVSDPDPEPEHVEHETEESTSDTEGTGTGQEGEWEEGEWDHAGARSDEEGAGAELGQGSVQRRRPRRARFTLSAQDAIGTKDVRKVRRERHAEERDRDRAVVVVYGLTPGKEYEVELRVIGVGAQDGEVVLSNSILIPPSPAGGARSRANSLRSRANPRSRSNSTNATPADILMPDGSSTAGTLAPSSGGLTPPIYPPPSEHLHGGTTITPTPILSAADTQAAQMRHLIASAHAEKEHLSVQIKEARRASQRAEAALRQEIESVKRAIEKAGSLDMRARQKTLALQEQVKQGWAGAEGAEESAQSVESGMADLEAQLRAVTLELQAVQEELEAVREREEDIRERDRRSRAEEEKKLADVQARLDKQRKVRDKKAGEKAELEKRLESIQKEQEETEKRFEEMRKRASMQSQHPGQYGYGTSNHAQNHHGMAWDPWDAHAHAQYANHTNHRLANHPSMPNIGAGAAFRPRGSAYQPRFASGGSRPNVNTANTAQVGPAQNSPTHPAGFAAAPNYPARPLSNNAVKATTSPALSNRLPPVAVPASTSSSATVSAATSNAGTGSTASPAHNQSSLPGGALINPSASPAVGGSSSGGTNPSAAPFMPSTASPSLGNALPSIVRTSSPALGASSPSTTGTTTSPSMSTKIGADYVYDPSHHTTLMPPSLQHRIYFSSNHAHSSGTAGHNSNQNHGQGASSSQAIRPRPSPNFHPPPSVLAEQAQRAQEAGTGVVRKGSISNPGAGPGAASSNTPPLPGSPSFPPLPSSSGNTTRAGSGDDSASALAPGIRSTSPLSAPGSATSASPAPSQAPQGPSLASIITRAVLQPGSGVLSSSNQNMGGRRTASPPYAHGQHGSHAPYAQVSDGRPGIMSRRSSGAAPVSAAFGAAAHLDQQLAQHAQQAQHAQHASHGQMQGSATGGPKVSFGPSAVQSAILARGSNSLNLGPAANANAAAGSRSGSANGMAGPAGSSSGNSRAGSGSGDSEFPPLSPLGPGGGASPAGSGQYQHGHGAHGHNGHVSGQGHVQQAPSVGPWSALNLGGSGH